MSKLFDYTDILKEVFPLDSIMSEPIYQPTHELEYRYGRGVMTMPGRLWRMQHWVRWNYRHHRLALWRYNRRTNYFVLQRMLRKRTDWDLS